MALTTPQDLFAASFDAVMEKKAVNQWAASGTLKAFEAKGFIKRVNLAETIPVPLDYRSNVNGGFLATDIDPVSLTKTSVTASAEYTPAEIGVPVNWTKRDEALNNGDVQKIDLLVSRIENAIESHDDFIETGLFQSSIGSTRFNSLRTIITNDGTGTVGGINSGTETFWANKFKDADAGAVLLADMYEVFTGCSKSSGSGSEPKLIITSQAGFGLYAGKLTPNQRFSEPGEFNGGAKNLLFLDAPLIYSHRAPYNFYFISPKAIQLRVAKTAFRQKGEAKELDGTYGYGVQVYSALQLVASNRSATGVVFMTP